MKRLRRLLLGGVLILGGASPTRAEDLARDPRLQISEAETYNPPTRERLAALESAAMDPALGWRQAIGPLHQAALRSFSQNRLIAADAWYHAFEWAELFAEPEDIWASGWGHLMESTDRPHHPLAPAHSPANMPMGNILSPQLQSWLFENGPFSEQFFTLLSFADHVPSVFAILEGLYRHGPERFARYSSLALAIAVVYDVSPPPSWPHVQVTAQALPRRLPNPGLTYERLIQGDLMGRNYLRVSLLRADELKFAVDTAASSGELDWSEANVPYGLDHFEGAYTMIRYRSDRAADAQLLTWAGQPYTLPAIKQEGGICIDQAYFATEAGKARGVPTLLFMGAGQDARHAWFGYLDGEHQWHLDAARYAELRLVTGTAIDPQTWSSISDHEVQFLAERFRALPSYQQSRVNQEFAGQLLNEGQPAAAAQAARAAVNYEHRNVEGWEILIAANTRLGLGPSNQEAVLREAARAFTPRYPDLVSSYETRVCASLRARGETSLANFEERGLEQRMQGDRSDIAIRQAAAALARSIATQPVPEQIATYNAILARFGHGESAAFFDEIVRAFAEHLALVHLRPQAREAVLHALEVLGVEPGSQMAMEAEKLLDRLQG